VFAHHPRATAAALPLAVVALVPALQWAALQADAERAWTRTESVLVGPPERAAFERARGFDTIGMLCMGRGLHERAQRMFERAAEAAPNPSTFVRIGMTETLLGRPTEAMTHYRRAATLDPRLPTAWRGLAAAASATGDRATMVEAVTRLADLVPDDPTIADARAWLAADSVRRASR
jgi:tetratricopeptide (TPR) repeat protein